MIVDAEVYVLSFVTIKLISVKRIYEESDNL